VEALVASFDVNIMTWFVVPKPMQGRRQVRDSGEQQDERSASGAPGAAVWHRLPDSRLPGPHVPMVESRGGYRY
jgi:hypothetical protein